MKRYFFGFAILFVIVIYSFSSKHISFSQPGDTYKLRYQMKKGETFKYSATTELESIQEVMGSETTSNSQIKSDIHITSEGNDDQGNIVFTMTYESLEINLNSSAMGDTSFLNPPGLIGKRVKKIISPFGDQLKSIEVDTIQGIPFMPQFSSNQEILPQIPESELKVGQLVAITDTDTTTMMGGSTISKINTEYTLVGKEPKHGFNCLKINFKGTITLEGDGTMQGMNFFLEGEGNNQGTMYFAPEEGLLVAFEGITDLEMTVAVTGQQNMTIPITQTINSKMTLIR